MGRADNDELGSGERAARVAIAPRRLRLDHRDSSLKIEISESIESTRCDSRESQWSTLWWSSWRSAALHTRELRASLGPLGIECKCERRPINVLRGQNVAPLAFDVARAVIYGFVLMLTMLILVMMMMLLLLVRDFDK